VLQPTQSRGRRPDPARDLTDLWVPAVNNWGGAGRWAFLEVTDPWDAEHLVRSRFIAPVATAR